MGLPFFGNHLQSQLEPAKNLENHVLRDICLIQPSSIAVGEMRRAHEARILTKIWRPYGAVRHDPGGHEDDESVRMFCPTSRLILFAATTGCKHARASSTSARIT